MRHTAADITSEAFPHHLQLAGYEFALAYHFEPGGARDGVTLTLPLAQLNQIPAARCEWLVPGLLKEKVVQLVRTLPQKVRAKLVPVPDFAAEFVAQVAPVDKPLASALADFILQSRGLNARGWEITADAFRPDSLPAHLAFNYRLLDHDGRQLAMSRSLSELRASWGREAKQEFSELQETPDAHSGMTDWTFGELPELIEVTTAGGQRVLGYPGLTDEGDRVSLRAFDSPQEARCAHGAGLLRLFMLHFREPLKYLERNLPGLTPMALQFVALGTLDELRRQLLELTLVRACLAEPWPTTEAGFRARCLEARPRLSLLAQEICRLLEQILAERQVLQKKLPGLKAYGEVVHDVEGQLAQLFGKRFVVDTPFQRLQHYPRYLKAAALRLDKVKATGAAGAVRDARLRAEFSPLWGHYERRAALRARQNVSDPALEQFRWLLEELRVQLFAQELRTPTPVSIKRLQKMWENLQGNAPRQPGHA